MAPLKNDDFIALRSIQKEPWKLGSPRLWKNNGTWRYIGENDFVIPLDYSYPRSCSPGRWNRTQAALERLLDAGLVVEEVERCCPGTSCHRNDKLVFNLTERGQRRIVVVECAHEQETFTTRASVGANTGVWARIKATLASTVKHAR